MQIKKKIKIKLFLLLSIPLLTLISGCEFKDIDKVVFVSMIGIDQSDDPEKPYKVILKLYVSTSSFRQNPKPEYSYLVKNGETISSAIRIMESHIDKELDFGHSKAIILGEELLKDEKNIEILDFLLRRPDIQMISYVAVGRPSAEKIVKMIPEGETAIYPTLFNYFDDNGTESPYIITTFLFDFRRRLLEDGLDLVIPIVEINDADKHFIVNKSYVLKDAKDPYELSTHKTLLLRTLAMPTNMADFVVADGKHYFIARIDSVKSNYKLNVNKQNEIVIDFNLNLVGHITESKSKLLNQHLRKYSELVEKEGIKRFTELLKELQKEGYDPVGFGLRYKAQTLPKSRMSTAEWRAAYKNATFNVNVKAEMMSTGSIQ